MARRFGLVLILEISLRTSGACNGYVKTLFYETVYFNYTWRDKYYRTLKRKMSLIRARTRVLADVVFPKGVVDVFAYPVVVSAAFHAADNVRRTTLRFALSDIQHCVRRSPIVLVEGGDTTLSHLVFVSRRTSRTFRIQMIPRDVIAGTPVETSVRRATPSRAGSLECKLSNRSLCFFSVSRDGS